MRYNVQKADIDVDTLIGYDSGIKTTDSGSITTDHMLVLSIIFGLLSIDNDTFFTQK